MVSEDLKSWNSNLSNYETISECGSESASDLNCSKCWS